MSDDEVDFDYLSVKEYANRFDLHIQSVYDAIARKKLPYQVIYPTGTTRVIRIAVPKRRNQRSA
mgnify:CR=1 FL=1